LNTNDELAVLAEQLQQELEIGIANNLSSIDIAERKLGIKPDSSWSIDERLANIEKIIERRFGIDTSNSDLH